MWYLLLVCSSLFAAEARAGTAFVPPRLVNSDTATTRGLDYGCYPSLAAGTSGTLVAVWTGPGPNPVAAQGQDPASPTPANEDIFFSRSLDHGRTWTPRAQLKTTWAADDGDDLEPSIATDGHGRWIAAWRSRDSLSGTLGYDADILAAISTDDGRTWSPPAPVNIDAPTDGGKDDIAPRIASDGQGRWVVSWTVYYVNAKGAKVEGVFASLSTDNGAHWSVAYKLFGRNYTTNLMGVTSSLDADGRGHWVIICNGALTGGPDSDIFPMLSSDNGLTWTSPNVPLNNDAYHGYDDQVPSLATDRNGTWVAAWPTNVIDPNTVNNFNPTYNIWFTRSFDNGKTWSPIARLNAGPETGNANNAGVHLANDGRGNWVAAWYTRQWGGDLDLAYAVSRDGGATWSPAAPLNAGALGDGFCDSGGYKTLDMATDGQGHWLTLWDSDNHLDGAPGSNRVILGAALSAAGIACTPTALTYLEGTRRAVDVTQNGQPTTATLTIQSAGLTPLHISALQIGGPHAADFSLLGAPPLPLTLAPGASQTLAVRFAPTIKTRSLGLAGTLAITSDDSSQTTLAVPLTGDAVPIRLSHFKAD